MTWNIAERLHLGRGCNDVQTQCCKLMVKFKALRHEERWRFEERCTYDLNECAWYEYSDCEKDKDNTLDMAMGAWSIWPGYSPDRSSEYLSKAKLNIMFV